MKNKVLMIVSLVGLLLLPILSARAGAPPRPIRIEDPTTKKIIVTTKVTRIVNPIDAAEWARYSESVKKTMFLPGERVVVINSPGGEIDQGDKIIALMELEKAMGTRMVCVVLKGAHSMAFNLLTHCDVRLALENATMVVHKVRTFVFGIARAKELRELADKMDKLDAPYRRDNSKAMGISGKDYDYYADKETEWQAKALWQMKYLQGLLPAATQL